MKYVNVVIDNNTDQTDSLYTYKSEFDDIKVGSKVRVPFAMGNRMKDGYVFEVMDALPSPIKNLKKVAEIDPEVSLTEEAVATCVWMRSRYFCRYIDAVNCFTPAGKLFEAGQEKKPFQRCCSGNPAAEGFDPGTARCAPNAQ